MARDKHEEWETEDVEIAKPVDVVISTRFAQELAERIYTAAQNRGVKTSALIREAVEAYLDGQAGTPATVDLTFSSADAPVTFYTGRSSQGRTEAPEGTLVAS